VLSSSFFVIFFTAYGPFQYYIENLDDADLIPPNGAVEKVSVKVDATELMGNEIFLYIFSGKNTFVARVDPRSKLRVGQQASVAFDMDSIHIFDVATEEAIR
jgi:multiple sugar transport system ATP-binding protein